MEEVLLKLLILQVAAQHIYMFLVLQMLTMEEVFIARTVSGTGTFSLLSYYGNTNNLFTLTEQWQRFYVDSVTTSTGAINFYAVDFRAGDLTEVLLYAPQMTKSPDLKPYLPTTDRVNLPRLNYPVYGGCPSLLVEPQRTNNVINSNSNFTANNTTITYNNINSPEEIKNAFKVECTSSGTAVFARTLSIAFTDPVTFSVFVKYGNAQYLQFLNSNTSSHLFNFDVKNGVFGTSGSGTTNLKAVEFANGWYRVSGTFTGVAATASFRVYISNSNSASYGSGTAAVGDFYYSYGWQVENGSYATSLIHTSGSTVTRNEDKALYAGLGTTDTFNDSEGVLFIETEALFNNNDGRGISINAGNGSNRVLISYPSLSESSSITRIYYKVQRVVELI